MLKVIFLTEALRSPSTRFRVLQNISDLKRHGIGAKVQPIPKSLNQRLGIIRSLRQYDIVLLQRRLLQWWVLLLIRRNSRVLIYDFDDALLYRDSTSPDFYSRSRLKRFRRTLRSVDTVVAGNEYLKRLALNFADRVTVIPTGINTELYREREIVKSTGPLTIGWIGSRSNLTYLEEMVEPINKLYTRMKNFKFKIVCDGFINGFECPVEKKWWREEEEVGDIQSFDIGVMPMRQDKWTRGKCALKLLQYLSCGVASVSSLTDVTFGMIKEGVNGLLVREPSEWVEKLGIILADGEWRKAMGKQGRRSIMGVYDSKTIASQYAQLFWSSYEKGNDRGMLDDYAD